MQEIRLIKSPENTNYLRVCSASFSQSTEHPMPNLHPDPLSGSVEGQSAVASGFILLDGKEQVLVGLP